jgi:hypothetical protein
VSVEIPSLLIRLKAASLFACRHRLKNGDHRLSQDDSAKSAQVLVGRKWRGPSYPRWTTQSHRRRSWSAAGFRRHGNGRIALPPSSRQRRRWSRGSKICCRRRTLDRMGGGRSHVVDSFLFGAEFFGHPFRERAETRCGCARSVRDRFSVLAPWRAGSSPLRRRAREDQC